MEKCIQKLKCHLKYLICFVLIALVLFFIFLIYKNCDCDDSLILTEKCINVLKGLAPTIISLALFISTVWFSFMTKKRADDQMTKELFTEFNRRYDRLNDKLNATMDVSLSDIEKDTDKKNKKIKTLNDYCNLCAEQYYWKKKGRIDGSIWDAWKSGMTYYYTNHKAFKEYWDKEMETNKESYYLGENDKIFNTKDQ